MIFSFAVSTAPSMSCFSLFKIMKDTFSLLVVKNLEHRRQKKKQG